MGPGPLRLDCPLSVSREGGVVTSLTSPHRPFSGESMLGLWGPRLPTAGILLLLPFLPLLLLPAAPASHRTSYKPVIVVHGLFDSSYSFRHLLEFINEVWQGTPGCGAPKASTVAGEGECGSESRPCGPAQFLGSWCRRGECWVGDEIPGSRRVQ